jgi:hypothetical protein
MSIQKKKRNFLEVLLLLRSATSADFVISQSQKETIMRKIAPANAKSLGLVLLALSPRIFAGTVPITNVEELYNAVNNPANAGATLALSAGTYELSANDPSGAPRANGGRIELQPNMALRGVKGDRTAVVISAYGLPMSSFPQNGAIAGPNAAIRMGLGRNSLEWLTVRDARFAQANIDSGLQPLDAATAFVRVAHVASSGSTRGLNVLNFGPPASGQTIEVDIIDSHFFDNDLNLSEGVRIGNFQGAVGSTVNARMLGNLSWGQKQGRLIVNNRTATSSVNVLSTGNWFYDNGAGTIIAGGLSSNNTRADGNSIDFEARGDWFISNTGETELDHGGLVVLGSEDISSNGGGSGNTVNVVLVGTTLLGNELADLVAIGARSATTETKVLSQNNVVTIEIRRGGLIGKIWPPVDYFANSLPAGEEDYGNQVLVIRH